MTEITQEFYDEDYYERGKESGKNDLTGAYVWERLGEYFTLTAKHIFKNFMPDTLLDVGCAKGYLIHALRKLNVDAYGVEWSKYAYDNAITKRFIDNRDIRTYKGRRTYDIVICFDMMEHIPEEDADTVLHKILSRAENWVVFNIGVEESPSDILGDKSHVNVKSRSYWEEKLISIGNEYSFELLPEGHSANSDVWWFNVPQSLFVLEKNI